MSLNIIHSEDSCAQILHQKASSVLFPLSKTDAALIEAMKEKLYTLGGVGLAAPQVNISKQIIAIYIPENAVMLRDNAVSYPMHILINPSYAAVGEGGAYADMEACYSVLSKAGKVQRYKEIIVDYQDEHGKAHQRTAHDFYARVLQHEIDHLNGILIIDRLKPDDVQGTIEEMMAQRRQELPEEKRVLFDKLIWAKTLKRN